MFTKITAKKEKIAGLEKENRKIKAENEDNRHEIEDLTTINRRLDRENDLLKEKFYRIESLLKSFDYRKSNSVMVLREIKEVITSDQTK